MADPWRKLNNTPPFGVDISLLSYRWIDLSSELLSFLLPPTYQWCFGEGVAASQGRFSPSRAGRRLAFCVPGPRQLQENELVDEAKASGLRTADFLQSTAGESDHGKQRQAKV
jgi:hypothetical protein